MLCKECPRKNNIVRVEPEGDPNSRIWVVGQAPANTEVVEGRPFVGQSGHLLELVFHKLGKKREDFYITNVHQCFHPPGQDLPKEVAYHCVKHLWGELKRYKPDVVLLLGKDALTYTLYYEKDFYAIRGYPLHWKKFGGKKITFIPTFHPSRILRENQAQAAHLKFFTQDVAYALHLLENPIEDVTPDSSNFILIDKQEEFNRFVKILLESGKPFAFDFETTHLRPYKGELVTVSFSNGDLTFAVDLTSGLHRFKPGLIKLFTSDLLKVAHNLQFETEWILAKLGVLITPPYEDTMLLAFSIRPNKIGLKDLANFYLKADDWDLDLKRKSVLDVPRKDLLIYNAYDAYYTIKLYHVLWPWFEKIFLPGSRWRYTYDNWYRDIPVYVAKAQYDGTPVDLDYVQKLEEEFKNQLREILECIYSIPYVKERTPLDLPEWEMVPGDDFLDKLVVVFSVTEDSPYAKVARKIRNKIFNIQSGKQIAKFLKDAYNIDVPLSEKGNPQVNEDVLKEINIDFTQKLLQLRAVFKNLKTYVVKIYDIVDEENKLHTVYHSTGTETSRFSSSDPNLQNWPKRKGKHLRNIFVAPKGYRWIRVDLKALEVAVLQMYAKDPILGKYLSGGGDMHFDTAKDLFRSEEKAKAERSRVKNGMVFPVFYGAGFQTVRKAFPDLSESRVRKVYDKLRQTFKKVIEWQQKVWREYCEKGYVEAFHGFRRYMPMNFNMVVNSPIQGFAAFLVWSAWIDLLRAGYWAPLYVHDEINLIVEDKPEVIKRAINDLYKFLLKRPFKVLKEVPLDMEVEIGYAWGNLEKIDYREYLED